MSHGHFGKGKYPATSKAPFPVTGAVRSDLARIVRRELSKMGFEPNGAVDQELLRAYVDSWLAANPPEWSGGGGGGGGGGTPSVHIDLDGVPYYIPGAGEIFHDNDGVPYFIVIGEDE